MFNANSSGMPSGYNSIEPNRVFISFALLVLPAICFWFMLPAIQSLIIPDPPTSNNGPWVIRPLRIFRIGSMIILSSIVYYVFTRSLKRSWARKDASKGILPVPVNRVLSIGMNIVLMLVFASSLVFYLFSWTTVDQEGIVNRLSMFTTTYSYQDIASLETIPEGERSESLQQEGPWYSILFKNGKVLNYSFNNEGMNREKLCSIATYIADRSGISWRKRNDSRTIR